LEKGTYVAIFDDSRKTTQGQAKQHELASERRPLSASNGMSVQARKPKFWIGLVPASPAGVILLFFKKSLLSITTIE